MSSNHTNGEGMDYYQSLNVKILPNSNQGTSAMEKTKMEQKLNEVEYKVECTRWVLWFAVASLNIINGFGFTMYSTILNNSEDYFNVNQDKIIQFSTVYFYAYLIAGIPAILICYWRLMVSINICAWISCIGIGIKLFAGDNYVLSLIGHVTLGLAQGFLYATPAQFSYRWFSEKESNRIISVLYFSNS